MDAKIDKIRGILHTTYKEAQPYIEITYAQNKILYTFPALYMNNANNIQQLRAFVHKMTISKMA